MNINLKQHIPIQKIVPIAGLLAVGVLVVAASSSLLSGTTPSAQVAVVAMSTASACSMANGPLNVKNFGAQGDGVTDDTAAFQAAAACVTSLFVPDQAKRARVSLYIPPGTYPISAPITFAMTNPNQSPGSGFALYGISKEETKIVSTAAQTFRIVPTIGSTTPRLSIDIHDISFISKQQGGTAVEVTPDTTGTAKLMFLMENVSMTGTSGNYFNYGLKATGIFVPSLTNVHMSGAGGTACFSFGASYGASVDNSSCSGTTIGIDMPMAGEGESVINSTIADVDTGIRITVVLGGGATGPSGSAGEISGNTIKAKARGVDITGKSYMYIQGNTFTSGTTGTYQDIRVTDTYAMMIAGNTFSGGGANRTGITLIDTGAPGPLRGYNNTVTGNAFSGLGVGVKIGSGMFNTVITKNTFTGTTQPIVNQGTNTVIHLNTIGGGDTTPPTVALTAPASGATVSGTIPVSATASDNVGVAAVEFKDGNTTIGTDTTGPSPYSFSWNTTSVANGSHTLVVVARDAAGNRATSTPRTVTVSNTTSSSCTLDGVTIANGSSRIFYKAPQSPNCNASLNTQNRTCTNGVLSGSVDFNKKSCTNISYSLRSIDDFLRPIDVRSTYRPDGSTVVGTLYPFP